MPGKTASPKRYHGYIPFLEKDIKGEKVHILLNVLPLYRLFKEPSASVTFVDEVRQVEESRFSTTTVVWKPNHALTMSLVFHKFFRSGHSIYSEWRDGYGEVWPIPLSELEKIIGSVGIPAGGVLTHDRWTFAKKGTSFFLVPEWAT